uniref:Sushi domain-containing protein n=1 Tax=Salarias fasciatus TaxID=181472 RepID=A0A672HGW1_SALFA
KLPLLCFGGDFLPDAMCRRFVLLLCLAGVLHAQTAARSCLPPSLDRGYFFPDQSVFHHGSTLTYACEEGHRPAAEGWWAEATCQHGGWAPPPRCIDENACLPPAVPNAGHTGDPPAWYEEGSEITVTCDEGFELRGRDASARCVSGGWTPLPACEERSGVCGEPPEVPHAVVVSGEYRAAFAAGSRVQYECEAGFTTEDGSARQTVVCEAGSWTKTPTCSEGCFLTVWFFQDFHRSPSESGSSKCGQIPVVANGVVVQTERLYFRFQCASYYKQVGSDTVRCYSDGSWSQEPTLNVGRKFLEDGCTSYKHYWVRTAKKTKLIHTQESLDWTSVYLIVVFAPPSFRVTAEGTFCCFWTA